MVLVIIVLVIRGGVVSNVYADYVNNTQDDCFPALASDLVAYWNFDEGSGDIVHDSSGNGNDGYIYNSYWISGYSGAALEFSNVDSIVYGIPDSLDDSITDYISIEAWIKWYGPYSNLTTYIFDCRMYFGGFIFCITDENKLGFGYYANNQNQPFIYGVSDIPINAWTHVKGVFDYSTKLMSLYVNGHLDSASTVAYPYVDSEAIEAIGNNHWAVLDGLWRPFHGIIDELKIWRIENHPPSAPSIDGPSYGFSTIAYQWNFRAVDPDNNDIFYQIDWGDGNVSVWYGSYNSGEVMSQSHAYSFNGKYTIKAKVKDIYGQESDWAILTVTMPYSFNKPMQLFLEPLFQRFPTAFPLLR